MIKKETPLSIHYNMSRLKTYREWNLVSLVKWNLLLVKEIKINDLLTLKSIAILYYSLSAAYAKKIPSLEWNVDHISSTKAIVHLAFGMNPGGIEKKNKIILLQQQQKRIDLRHLSEKMYQWPSEKTTSFKKGPIHSLVLFAMGPNNLVIVYNNSAINWKNFCFTSNSLRE